MSDFKPYWTRHPHQLRVFSLLVMAFSPVLFPVCVLIAMCWHLWSERRVLCNEISRTYAGLWAGLTHTMAAKPIFRPVAGSLGWFLLLVVPNTIVLILFSHFAPNIPVWALILLYLALLVGTCAERAHERKKARDKAGLDEHAAFWADR